MDAENQNQLYAHIDRLNARIANHESAFCGIVESLNNNDIETAFLLATEALCPRHAQAATSAASFAEKAVQVRPGHEVSPTNSDNG